MTQASWLKGFGINSYILRYQFWAEMSEQEIASNADVAKKREIYKICLRNACEKRRPGTFPSVHVTYEPPKKKPKANAPTIATSSPDNPISPTTEPQPKVHHEPNDNPEVGTNPAGRLDPHTLAPGHIFHKLFSEWFVMFRELTNSGLL